MPYYQYEDFKRACVENMENVIPIYPVMDDAGEHFNLYSISNLLQFIGNDGLENRKFIGSDIWDKNPEPSNEIFIDAYEFRSMDKLGYIAFMHNVTTKKWIIKSFHLSNSHNPNIFLTLDVTRLIETEENL